MSDQQRYDFDEQWDDLPLPEQEASWQKMKQLLEDDEDRIIPPVLLRSCAGWGLLILLIVGSIWLMINNSRHKENISRISHNHLTLEDSQNKIQKQQNTDTLHNTKRTSTKKNNQDSIQTKHQKTIIQHYDLEHPFNTEHITSGKTRGNNKTENQSYTYSKRSAKPGKLSRQKQKRAKNEQSSTPPKSRLIKKHKKLDTPITEPFIGPTESDDTSSLNHRQSLKDLSISHADSSKKADSSRHTEPGIKPESKSRTKKPYYVSVGIGEQQQIPFMGQKAVPYNYYGRKSSLSDYIPSIYVRLERDKKWFVQSEFRYGAPQSVKQLAYSQVAKSDSFNRSTTSTTLSVKKTYYHQIPFSFNYYILPNWSIGTGALYSKFYGAITEQTTKIKNNLTQAETVSSKLVKIPASTDSFFTKSQLYILLQTQYQWKRFSFGLRFMQGLQPYIRYKDASGAAKEEKNKTLEFLVRFRIVRTRMGEK